MKCAAAGRLSPTAAGISAIFLWSTTVALARSTAEQLGPLTAGLSVYFVAGLVLTIYRIGKDRSLRPKKTLSRKYVFGCGALFVLYTIAFFLALGLAKGRIQTVEIGLVNYLWPALTLLFSLFLLGNRGGVGLIPGTVFALSGVFVVVTQSAPVSWGAFLANLLDNPAAYGLGFFAAVTWGLYSNLARRWGSPQSGGAVHMFVVASGIAFAIMRVFIPEEGMWSVRTAADVRPRGSVASSRTIVPSVSVPVLSVQRTSMLPRFSIASRRRTITPCRPIARAPAESVTLTIAGRSSGDSPTASATANRSDSIRGRWSRRFTVRTNSTITTIDRIRR